MAVWEDRVAQLHSEAYELADIIQAQLDAAEIVDVEPDVFEEVHKELIGRW